MTASDHHRRITTLAADRAVHRAFAWLHLHEPQLRRWQLELLAIPAPTFHESYRAEFFLQKFHELGLQNPQIDAAGNALAELTSSPLALDPGPKALGPAPCILLSAHLDTVFAAGTVCTPSEEGDVIHAPGACDNGAGLTALLGIIAAMQHAQITPAVTILFAANVGEEGEGDLRGMRHLFSSESPYFGRIKAAIALEGAGTSTVVDRALGSRRLRVAVHGPGGHSWADAGLPNPILALSAALVALGNLQLPANPRTTLNVGTIEGGTSVNSIPSSASCGLDLRSTSALELDRIELAVLKTLEANIQQVGGLSLQVARIGDRPSGALNPDSSLARSLSAVDRHLSLRTESRIGSTDANLPLSMNVPALALGAGGAGGGIHTLGEWHNPTGRELALRRVLLLLLDVATM